MLVMFVKLKGHCTKVVLNTLSLIKNAVWTDECERIEHIKKFMSRYTSVDTGVTTSDICSCDINVEVVKNNVQIIDLYKN